jgi:hypothetical protein
MEEGFFEFYRTCGDGYLSVFFSFSIYSDILLLPAGYETAKNNGKHPEKKSSPAGAFSRHIPKFYLL